MDGTREKGTERIIRGRGWKQKKSERSRERRINNGKKYGEREREKEIREEVSVREIEMKK